MKHYLVISGIVGGIIGSVLTALLISPAKAHRDKFGEIECTRLAIVDAEGNERILLSTNLSEHVLSHKVTAQGVRVSDTKVRVLGTEYGGRVQVYDEDGATVVLLDSDKLGGYITVSGKDGISGVQLKNLEHGGFIGASGKNAVSGVSLGLREHGGFVDVKGKNAIPSVLLGIDEHGNGAVSTWDKNGYRQ